MAFAAAGARSRPHRRSAMAGKTPGGCAMPKAKGRGIEGYYERAGEAPPLLFISGTGGDLRVKPNVFDGPLGKAFDLLGYDQRGLGRTEKPDEPYTMAA